MIEPDQTSQAELVAELLELRRANTLLREKLAHQDVLLEEAARIVEALRAENEKLKKENESLRREVAEEKRSFIKANTKSDECKKPGAPPGHKGCGRPRPPEVDEIVIVKPKCCPHCGSEEVKEEEGFRERVVTDVEFRVRRRKYRLNRGYCPRCKRSFYPEPEGCRAGERIGPNASSAAGYMRTIGIPGRKIEEIFENVFGLKLTHTTILSKETKLAKAAEPLYAGIEGRVRESERVHIDETGWRVDGKNWWLWCFVNKAAAYFHIDRSRGRGVPEGILGREYKGIAITDFYSAYNKLPCGGRQPCMGHLLREVKRVEGRSEGEERAFCRGLKETLKSSIEVWRRFRAGEIDERELSVEREGIIGRTVKLIEGAPTGADAQRIVKRLLKHHEEIFRFLYDPRIEPTNNEAERALRPSVVKRKTSFGSRSERGARNHSVLTSVVQTAQRQGLGGYDTIRRLLLGKLTEAELLPVVRPP